MTLAQLLQIIEGLPDTTEVRIVDDDSDFVLIRGVEVRQSVFGPSSGKRTLVFYTES